MITCLSSNDISVKIVGMNLPRMLSKKMSQTSKSGTTMSIYIIGNMGALLRNPDRGNLQAAYDRNLQDYFLEYKNAVPVLANISLRDEEVTPLILDRCAGLDGTEYYSTEKIETGDVDYESKVFVYKAKAKPTRDDFARLQGFTGGTQPAALYTAPWKI